MYMVFGGVDNVKITTRLQEVVQLSCGIIVSGFNVTCALIKNNIWIVRNCKLV